MRDMKEQINFSVVIPFRDSLEQLSVALKSIPDRKDIQVIVVDNSRNLFEEEQYPKYQNATLTITSSEYGAGAGCARNVGLKFIGGEWLLFLDADDYFMVNAFDVFDKFKDSEYDIIYFKADSVNLTTGERSKRHKTINKRIDCYLSSKNEDYLRYQFGNPVCKMIRSSLVLNNNIQFEEVKCSNDVMFSVKSGHLASTITAVPIPVYMITEAPSGVSLMTDKSAENSFIRFQVSIRKYAYLRSIGKTHLKPRFFSHICNALRLFGLKEAYKYIKYYYKNRNCRD